MDKKEIKEECAKRDATLRLNEAAPDMLATLKDVYQHASLIQIFSIRTLPEEGIALNKKAIDEGRKITWNGLMGKIKNVIEKAEEE